MPGYIRGLLAIAGFCLGVFLGGLAYSTQLGSPLMNNIVFFSGVGLTGGCAVYLFIKVMRRLVN